MDDNDKTRRNLVVASTVVIAIAWLKIPVPFLLERFALKGSGLDIPPWKIWLMLTLMISYLGWRYRWSEDFMEGWADHVRASEERYSTLFQQEYFESVADWIRTGLYPSDAHPEVEIAVDKALGYTAETKKFLPITVSFRLLAPADPKENSAAVQIDAEWREGQKVERVKTPWSGQNSLALLIDSNRKAVLWARSKKYAHLNSKASMAILWPLGLGGTAGCIVLFRLVRSAVAGQ